MAEPKALSRLAAQRDDDVVAACMARRPAAFSGR